MSATVGPYAARPATAVDDGQVERENSLYAAHRLSIGDDRWDSTDLIVFAEYIRTGAIPETPEWARRAAGAP